MQLYSLEDILTFQKCPFLYSSLLAGEEKNQVGEIVITDDFTERFTILIKTFHENKKFTKEQFAEIFSGYLANRVTLDNAKLFIKSYCEAYMEEDTNYEYQKYITEPVKWSIDGYCITVDVDRVYRLDDSFVAFDYVHSCGGNLPFDLRRNNYYMSKLAVLNSIHPECTCYVVDYVDTQAMSFHRHRVEGSEIGLAQARDNIFEWIRRIELGKIGDKWPKSMLNCEVGCKGCY